MKRSITGFFLSSSFLLVIVLAGKTEAQATVRRVPTNYSTIQQAINASVNGDMVLVAPGTYVENINFLGKAITVTSEAGPDVTILDGNQTGTVVKFVSGEGPASVISNFTIRNGFVSASDDAGAGIFVLATSPTITGNIITANQVGFDGGGILIIGGSPSIVGNTIANNRACSGAGINVRFGTVLIKGNIITGNRSNNCSTGFTGAGIYIGGGPGTQILDNLISQNTATSRGGGVLVLDAGVRIQGNRIIGNQTFFDGAGIAIFSDAVIVQNLITSNKATSGKGAGIYWLVSTGFSPAVINNTVADNDANLGSALFADGFDGQAQVMNNVLIAKPGQIAVYCGDFNDTNNPQFKTNNVFSQNGLAYGGTCPDQTGFNGNISADPLFVSSSTGDYHLRPGSPSIDSGDTGAPNLPATDLDGHPRIQDGNGDGIAIVDIGAYEASLPFDICIQDDSSGSILRINSTTGDYQFTNCSGFTLSGIGGLIKRGGTITLQHYASDRRVLARVDTGVNKGTASIQLLSPSTTFTITDRNTANNTCACAAN